MRQRKVGRQLSETEPFDNSRAFRLGVIRDDTRMSAAVNGGDEAKVAAMTTYLESLARELASPLQVEDQDIGKYEAVVLPGGHGPMQDLAVDRATGKLLAQAAARPDVVVAALCHGQAGLLSAGDAQQWAFKGRRVTGFSNVEETQVGLAANAPWLLEDRLRDAGALYESEAPWHSHVVVDGNLVTGQNPQSAEQLAEEVIRAIGER
ncbi:type 1 glutamine amidotransferase domain-containing protein [Variovorax sp. Root411]|uniref:type 1 glutamine amidotransferase domain-containing protein n=1 Tax=Variovorax sp. Root411 TaxID=1736530 RepID=UPI000AB8BDD1|nr:type 1 glutamine amidotransferase domain-containing protein [Variovorax sp. Root411]